MMLKLSPLVPSVAESLDYISEEKNDSTNTMKRKLISDLLSNILEYCI